MIALLDTTIIVDLLRNFAPAEIWLEQQSKVEFGIPRIVWLEILEGVGSKVDQAIALRLLRRFEVVETIPDDGIWASTALISIGLAVRFDGYDCMIAAVSHRLHLPLYTRNLKHFKPLIGDLAVTPY